MVVYFIPNMINIFLGAFNFLDSRRKYTTLWEKHLLLEIVYKFFIIPYCVYQLLKPFIDVTAKVYLATAMIIVAIGLLVSIYQRWLRPLPDEIVNCTNLDKQMERGVIEPKVGQTNELEKLISALEGGLNVLLIGRSGEGKTSLVHHLIALKHVNQLPEKLQNLAMFELDCGLMISSVTYGHSELITQTKEQCEGFEENIFLLLDEFYQIATNKAAFQAFKKRFLEDKPQVKFVATMTLKEFREIQKLDIDGSFRRRVHPIFVESSSEEQNRLVLRGVQRTARDIRITEDAIDAALELSDQEDYLPDIGRPAKAIKIVTDAIGRCRSAFNPHHVSEELSQARQKYQEMKLHARNEVKVSTEVLKKIRQMREKIESLEEELKGHKETAKKIKKFIEVQQNLNQEYYKISRQLSRVEGKAIKNFDEEDILEDLDELEKGLRKQPNNQLPPLSKESISPEAQIAYLWIYFYAIDAMKKIINDEIEKVRPHLPVQVDADLIYEVYDESLKIEQELYDDQESREEHRTDEKTDHVYPFGPINKPENKEELARIINLIWDLSNKRPSEAEPMNAAGSPIVVEDPYETDEA